MSAAELWKLWKKSNPQEQEQLWREILKDAQQDPHDPQNHAILKMNKKQFGEQLRQSAIQYGAGPEKNKQERQVPRRGPAYNDDDSEGFDEW